MNRLSPLTLQDDNSRDSAWARYLSVKARVAGSGDIVVCSNPPRRDQSVAGSGDIKFRK